MKRLEEIVWEDIEMVPEITRDSVLVSPNNIASLVLRLGQPVVLDAKKYLRGLQKQDVALGLLANESDFFYVRFPVSVRPQQGKELRFLSLDIQLHAEGGNAVAWAMQPEKVEQEVKIKVDASIGAELKFKPVSVSAKDGDTEEFVAYQPIIEAFNLGTSDPAWEFRPAPGRNISGIQLLHLVVRQPRNSRTEGRIAVRADVAERGSFFNLFGRVTRTNQPSLKFECA